MKKTKPHLPKLRGRKIKVWWETGEPDNMATILEVLPYTGRYPEFCDCVLKLPAPRTRRGWLEMAYNSKDFAHDSRK
jgi:hypothetical protein